MRRSIGCFTLLLQVLKADPNTVTRDESRRKISSDYDRRGASVLAAPDFYRDRGDDLLARATREWWESALPPADQRVNTRLGAPKLLDLCCGTGAFSVYPAKIGYQVWGVDLSPKSIEAAELQAKINRVSEGCCFQVDDAVEFLRRTREKFDVISICGSLYYLELETVLPLICDRLAEGGTFLCLETNGGNRFMSGYRRWRNRNHHHRDAQTLTGLLRESDYRAITKEFAVSRMEFFDCLTLLTPLVFRLCGSDRSQAERYHAWARQMDQLLLRLQCLHGLAFKIGLIGVKLSEPSKLTDFPKLDDPVNL